MSEEEKEAIEELKKFSNLIIEGGIPNSFIVNKLKITFNLIDKQQKDLENLKEVERQICDEELITKDKYQDILKENEELKTKYRKNGRVLFTIEAINERYVSKDKIRELAQEYKPNQSNTFIESQERYIELVKKLELLGNE